jgi:hypothetical protein
MDLRWARRLLSQYVKRYHAGAFAVPVVADFDRLAAQGYVHLWRDRGDVVGLEHPTRVDSVRRDFTGRRYVVPKGTRLLSHLASTPGAELPDLRGFDAIYAYAEDMDLVAQLRFQGFAPQQVRITAASEILPLYAAKPPYRYEDYEDATLRELPLSVPPTLQARILEEIAPIQGWRDDFPYYHHGEWSQACLRGYSREDPFWGVKPPEMSKVWKHLHPDEALRTTCDWTVLAAQMPALLELLAAIPWWRGFERVRLLRLTTGQLTRHTDITDRTAGTSDGQICRFHIPLVTHPDVMTFAWDLCGRPLMAHWEPWHLYYLDQRKPHAVVNPSAVERIHLVVDVVSDAAVRQAIGQRSPDRDG